MERHSEGGQTNAELLEIFLGRSPAIPIPPKNSPGELWEEFERQDPEAFEILGILFHSGIRILARPQEETGDPK
jgi:hypothetical protein